MAQFADGDQLSGANLNNNLPPIGSILAYAGTTAPNSKWLLCNGQAVSRTTYSDLFNIISTTFGAGNGSTTFNVPDLRGRTIIGLDNLGGSSANRVTNAQADSLGGVEGSEEHTLTEAEMPAHTHGSRVFAGGNANSLSASATIDNSGTQRNTDSKGGGGAHNNMQPYMALGYIIKALGK